MSQNNNSLSIGDESLLWTFGSEAQNMLGFASRVMADVSSSDNSAEAVRMISIAADCLEMAIQQQKSARIHKIFRQASFTYQHQKLL